MDYLCLLNDELPFWLVVLVLASGFLASAFVEWKIARRLMGRECERECSEMSARDEAEGWSDPRPE